MNFDVPGNTDTIPVEKRKAISSALEKIMTVEEYRTHEHPTPYELHLDNGTQELTYIGTSHEVDPSHPEFSLIKTQLKAFIERHGASAIMMVEGGEIPKAKTEAESIQSGEMAYSLYLAEKAGCEWRSPEPTWPTIFKELEKQGFQKDDIATWYTLLDMQWPMDTKEEAITLQFLGRLAFRMEELIGPRWVVGLPSRQEAIALYKNDPDGFKKLAEGLGRQLLERFQKEFERISGGKKVLKKGSTPTLEDAGLDPKQVNDFVDPSGLSGEYAVTNKIGTAFNVIRDRVITTSIAEALANGKNVFAVFGSSHTVMQEPALREIWEKVVDHR